MAREYLTVLGHQPDLSVAELESLYSADKIDPIKDICFLNTKPDINVLGGSPKVARVIAEFPRKDLEELIETIVKSLDFGDTRKKANFGISSYLKEHSIKDLKTTALKLKKRLQQDGLKPRYTPNKNLQLNSAQVWHNKLDKEPNFEIILVEDGPTIFVARTIGVQNIGAYAKRDRDKPVRDMKVGMLPPKLARQMINLAGPTTKVLDPFCGTGTVLMEASLMGYQAAGSDISMSMVEATRKNMMWLKKKYRLDTEIDVIDGDAQEHRWPSDITSVVSETYLGPPIKKFPLDIDRIVSGIDTSLRSVLRNLHRQSEVGDTICLAVPVWYNQNTQQYTRLPLVDELASLKYNLVDFKHVDSKQLIYRRSEQIVGRQMLIIKRS